MFSGCRTLKLPNDCTKVSSGVEYDWLAQRSVPAPGLFEQQEVVLAVEIWKRKSVITYLHVNQSLCGPVSFKLLAFIELFKRLTCDALSKNDVAPLSQYAVK